MSDRPLRVTVHLGGVDHMLTLDEWRELRRGVAEQVQALKVKCPTCRCRIMPDDWCMCCADTTCEMESPI